jgi:predicted kinase
MQPLLVIVSGPPAAGKTTIAVPLARRLGLPLLAKDTLKETLHDVLGGEGRAWSQRLGIATFELMFRVLDELIANGCSVVAEGNFSRREAFLALPPARLVEVHVTAPPEVLRERYASRPPRHAVHYDREVVDEVPERAAAGEWDPLGIGETLLVDTTAPVDVEALARRVRTLTASA